MGILIEQLAEIRASEPERISRALALRPRADLAATNRLLVIACDHPARGALGAGSDPMAMASREDLLRRCVTALSRPGVNGFLGSADLIEDLALLGALDGKLVWGSMNRIGLQGAAFEIDDRFGGYDARGIVTAGLNGGKMLTRIDYDDPATARTLEASAHAIDALADRGLNAMIEPFISRREDGRVVNDLSTDAVIRSIAVAQGLGHSSAHTWLKLPSVADMDRVMESTTLPSLILGGEVSENPEAARASWGRALALPNVRGLVIGRSLLYPPDDNVEAAVDNAVELL
ncbi:MAG: deoxyribose-phosphate aldolase [Propionibacteriaceae bacterium]|uniref:Aldolase-type TIM barrel n=1 Tax=Propionibacterium ruminifibrarum TaxID=1962131 RepID=A0A375I0D7_9ACTN|nr:deoxyribose-phosphate aldolase [Propionibacterium ruminifibrarum]MBE6476591.1 deoxyribose-phosphate aldolase [Propionibacteriaceae bacterium]SPF67021.1 Aldolase-type TIM barrel [Propionibacterium ruminifibrarum]